MSSRTWVRGWLASLAVHVGAILVIHHEWHLLAPTPRTVVELAATPVEVETVAPAHPQTIDFAFLDSSTASTPGSGTGARAQIRGSSSTGTGEPPSTPTRTGTGTMKMRGPELHPSDVLEHIAAAPGHEPPPPPLPSKRLDDAPGGGSVIHDTVTTINVDRDGTAHLHDKPDIEVNFDANPLHFWRGLNSFGRGIADWAEDPTAAARVGPSQDLSAAQQAVPGNCDHFGDTMCTGTSDAPVSQQNGVVGIPILSGKFDETSFLMRKLGVGDAFAARKLKALDDTRSERAERGARYKQTQLDHSAQLMQANLHRVWAVTRNVDERKVALFELWDECTEDDAGDRARTMVIGWIRANLPQDKPGAYTTSELAVFATQRTSKAPFTPYEESPR
jgi:hypothetical protein